MAQRHTALLLAGLLVLSAGGAVAVTAPIDSGTLQQAEQQDTPTVTFENQTATDTVTVATATLPGGGFVAIHESDNGTAGDIVGVSAYLEPGPAETVEVALDTPVSGNAEYIAMAHRDTNGNETFDFGPDSVEDGAYIADGDPVTDAAQVTEGVPDDATDDDEGPTGLVVTDLNAPANATVGQTLAATATVENRGEESVTEQVEFRFAGTLVANRAVSIDGDGNETVTFEVPSGLYNLSAGEYTHGVFTETDGQTATITLDESFALTDLEAPANATVGDEVTVNATVQNPNDENATQTVEFRFAGTLADSEGVELGAGESTTVSLSVDATGVEPGNYTHAVFTTTDGAFAEITLEPAPPEANVTFDNQTSDGTTVEVASVTTSDGGFVAIHDATLLDGNVVGSVIGTSEYLDPGENENVTVELFDVPGAAFENETLIAMPHLDTNGTETYDFVATNGSVDSPYTEDGAAVLNDAFVTVGSAAPPTPNATETATETTTDTDTATGTDTAAEPGTETGTATQTGTETATETQTETATETATETDTETQTGTETETTTDTETGTDTDTETGTETETTTETETDTDDTDTETDAGQPAEPGETATES